MKPNIEKLAMVRESMTVGHLTIHKPEVWETDEVEIGIQNYDYDSTKIEIDDLKILHMYIGQILECYE